MAWVAPCLPCVIFIMVGAHFVDACDFAHGLFGVVMIFLFYSFAGKVGRGGDEDVEGGLVVFEDVIAASPYDDAGSFGCHAAYELALGYEQAVVWGESVVCRHDVVHHDISPDALCGAELLFVAFHVVCAEAAALYGKVDELTIVELPPEAPGKLLAYLMSAAAELTSDGDNRIFRPGCLCYGGAAREETAQPCHMRLDAPYKETH